MGSASENRKDEWTALDALVVVLGELGIRYAIGGSLASSTYGTPRFTHDADMTVEPFEDKAGSFVKQVSPHFYVNEDAVREALTRRASFNVIHLQSAAKIDLFVARDTEYDQQVLSRTRELPPFGSDAPRYCLVSPEDIVLLKLQWFEQGGRSSQRQWTDILGVLAVQADHLDDEYIRHWAGRLGLSSLLDEAIAQARNEQKW